MPFTMSTGLKDPRCLSDGQLRVLFVFDTLRRCEEGRTMKEWRARKTHREAGQASRQNVIKEAQ